MNKQKIIGVYLAAGKSSRFGSNKLLAPLLDKPLGAHGLRAAIQSNLKKVVVVTNDKGDLSWITTQIKQSDKWVINVCINAHHGLSQSLICGLKTAEVNKAKAIIVMLADQPLITTTVINKLINIFNKNPQAAFVGYKSNTTISPPMLISNKLFTSIYDLSGDQGALNIIQKNMDNGILLPLDNHDVNTVYDVDTIKDYSHIKTVMNASR